MLTLWNSYFGMCRNRKGYWQCVGTCIRIYFFESAGKWGKTVPVDFPEDQKRQKRLSVGSLWKNSVDSLSNNRRKRRKSQITVCITALEDVYFNYQSTSVNRFRHDDCQFYMPGFWYRRNLRSPKSAPSFHTSDSWLVREDRLSTPLTGIYSEGTKRFMTVNRIDQFENDALTTHREGEVILSGKNLPWFHRLWES